MARIPRGLSKRQAKYLFAWLSGETQQDRDARAIKIDPGPWPEEEKQWDPACFVGVDDVICGKHVAFVVWTGDGPLWDERTWSCPEHLGWVVQSMTMDDRVAHVTVV